MNEMKRDMIRIQELVGSAFGQTGALVALSDGGHMNPKKLQKTLEQTMEHFESAALELRRLCEQYSPGTGGFSKKSVLPAMDVTGSVEEFGYGHDLDITQREMRYASIPDLRNEYHPGMEIDCIVKVFDPDNDKLEISIKETEVNPFFGAEQRHPVGSRRLAVISGKYGGGVFCNLPDGVVCMCNYSYQHEDADFMVGENVMLIVQRYEDEKLQMYGKIMSKW